MYSATDYSAMQITFHYMNGQSESYSVLFEGEATTVQDLRQDVKRFLAQDWWVVKTATETVMIKSSNVLKIEIKPPMDTLQGDGVLYNAERITALTRSR